MGYPFLVKFGYLVYRIDYSIDSRWFNAYLHPVEPIFYR